MAINNTKINLITSAGKKTYSLLRRSEPVVYVEGFKRTAAEACTDVVKITRKGAHEVLSESDKTKIIKMREAGLSQEEMAKELGITERTLQIFLKKHMPEYSDCRSKIIPAISKYFSATSKAEKEKAFSAIDKHLAKLAKERVKKDGSLSYEDCLQDLRLLFLELERTKGAGKNLEAKSFYNSFLYRLQPTQASEIKIVPLTRLDDSAKEISTANYGIAQFEADDLCNFFLETDKVSKYGSLERGSFPSVRAHAFVIDSIKEGKTLEEIGELYGLTKARVKTILDEAMEALQTKYPLAVSGENYEWKIKAYQMILKALIKNER